MNKTLFTDIAVNTRAAAAEAAPFRPTPVPSLAEPVELTDSELDAVTGGASSGFLSSDVDFGKGPVDILLKAAPT